MVGGADRRKGHNLLRSWVQFLLACGAAAPRS